MELPPSQFHTLQVADAIYLPISSLWLTFGDIALSIGMLHFIFVRTLQLMHCAQTSQWHSCSPKWIRLFVSISTFCNLVIAESLGLWLSKTFWKSLEFLWDIVSIHIAFILLIFWWAQLQTQRGFLWSFFLVLMMLTMMGAFLGTTKKGAF